MKAINETIANAIAENIEGNNGTFSVEVEVSNTLIVVNGSFEIDGYCEDDYFNGTGAWVTTYVSVCIDSVESYDGYGNRKEKPIKRDYESCLVICTQERLFNE